MSRPNYLELFPKASGDELIKLVCTMEAEKFDDDERGGVMALLRWYIDDNRNSDDREVLIAVGSAIRKCVAMADRDDLGWMETLLDTRHSDVDIRVELEVAKMASRKFWPRPPKYWHPYPGLSGHLTEIVEVYLHPRIFSKGHSPSVPSFGAVAMLAAEAVLIMGVGMGPMVARVVDQVGAVPLWFRQQLRRRLEKNTSGWPELDRSHVREVMDQIDIGWQFPLKHCSGIPINHHPGAFGFQRESNRHTGVDLYCNDEQPVYAVEDGTVVKVDIFTGPSVGHEWWEETYGIMVEGASGVVNYGEVAAPDLKVGDAVKQGEHIGKVKRVLFKDRYRPDIPGHSTSMLHVELYKHGSRDFADWNSQRDLDLLDPTPHLMQAKGSPANTLTWGNEEGKTVG